MENENDQFIIPKLTLTITTYELVEDKWIAVLSHNFYADTEEGLYTLIKSHKETDRFFDASECKMTICEFDWKGGKILLKNSKPRLSVSTIRYS